MNTNIPSKRLALVDLNTVRQRTSRARSPLYRDMAAGTFPKPIKLGTSSLWPEHEIDAMVAAYIAEATEDELKELVADLMAARGKVNASVSC